MRLNGAFSRQSKRACLFYAHADDRLACRGYQTAVSLHSHTLHSRESLAFLPRLAGKVPLLAAAIRWQQARCSVDLDLTRAWWTPPLSPAAALRLESEQISVLLSMEPLVSLTDHDNIDAIHSLAAIENDRRYPVSIEWTVPFRGSYFHLGVHNLAVAQAPEIVAAMHSYTSSPSHGLLAGILAWLDESPDTLVVFNHPYWDEKGIGAARHAALLSAFVKRYRGFLHAVEINGLRPWKENRLAIALGETLGLPVISGGDRHGREPNGLVNLTNAVTFSEFVEEVRSDGWSLPLILPQYHEPHARRVMQTICDVLRDEKEHGLGWTRWSDRFFYRCDDGSVKPLSALWGDSPPALVRYFLGFTRIAGGRGTRETPRMASARGQEVIP